MEDDPDQNPVIVIDNGSGYLKAGFSNQSSPEICIPAVVGREILRYGEKIDLEQIRAEKNKLEQKKLIKQMIKEHYLKQIMVGDEIIGFRSLLEISHPISEGVIVSEEDLSRLWEYTLTEKLKIGIDTGIVLDSGDGVTHCIPVSDGNILKYSIERMDIAGRHITEYLCRLLQKKGYAFNSSADFEFVRELKEKYCFISNDIEGDRKLERETTYYNSFHLLPDETRIRISDEKFEAPEILFNPSLIGKEYDGIPIMMIRSINNCPMDCRPGLYGNIILSGATTLFPGFATRVEKDIKKIYKETALRNTKDKKIKININVIASPKRKYSVFIGASIIANHYNNLDNEDYWITRDEWLDCEDKGSYTKENLIKNKCQSYLKDKE